MIGQHVEENQRMCLSLFLCSCHPLFNEKQNFQLFQFNNHIPPILPHFLTWLYGFFRFDKTKNICLGETINILLSEEYEKNGYELDNDLFEPPIFTVFDDCFSEASFSVLFELP